MKALVPGAILVVTAITVVVGANVVMGERDSGSANDAAAKPTVDPKCEANPPNGGELACIPLEWFTIPGLPGATPSGLTIIECEPVPPEDLEEYADVASESALSEDHCVGAGKVGEPDSGPRLPAIVINGKRVELPEDVVIGAGSVGHAIEIIIGESTVTLTRDGTLLHSDIRPADEAAMKPILDAVAGD